MDALKSNVALAHPYPEGKPCSKFGCILPSGLGGDGRRYCVGQMDRRRTDGKIILHPHNPHHERRSRRKFTYIVNSANWFGSR